MLDKNNINPMIYFSNVNISELSDKRHIKIHHIDVHKCCCKVHRLIRHRGRGGTARIS